MSSPSYKPEGFHTVTPYFVAPDAAKLIEFAKAVFDAEEIYRMPGPGGQGIVHAEFRVGDSVLETADSTDQWPPMPMNLHVYVPDVDAVYEKAVAAEADVVMEPTDQFYGERSASIRDPAGNLWHIATKTEHLSAEEIQKRAADLGHV